MKTRILFFLTAMVLAALFCFTANAQVAGDYGSAATGNWGTDGTNWLVFVSAANWSDATVATLPPAATNNVFIRAGHTVTMEASGKNCKNLTVQSGATLLTVTTQWTLAANGDIQIDGTLGSLTVAPLVQFGVSGKIFGTGTAYFSRMRPNAAGVKMTVDMNLTGIGSTGNYINFNGFDNTSLEIKAGRVVTLPIGGYIAVGSNSGTSDPTNGANVTIDVYGTINAPVGTGGGISLANKPTFTTTLNVYSTGIINTGRLSALAASTAAAINVNINSGGAIVLTSNLSNDAGKATVAINGTFDCDGAASVAFGTATVGSTGTLRLASGAYPTGTVNLSAGSTVEYYGAAGYTLPATPTTYENLTINNAAGLTLGASTVVNGSLALSNGALTTGANALAVTGAVTRGTGYVDGTLTRTVGTGGTPTVDFYVGTGTAYTPISVVFTSTITTGGTLTVKSTAAEHPSLATSGIDGTKDVNRYYTVTNSGIVPTNFSMTLNWVGADVDAGANTANFGVKKFDGALWYSLVSTAKNPTSIQTTSNTSFSDFAVGEITGYTINSSAGLNGSIAPLGNTVVLTGGTQSYVITPDVGYQIATVTVDGSPAAATSPYTFTNVTFDHTISATFSVALTTITSNGTGGGDWFATTTWAGGVIPSALSNVVVLGTDSASVNAAGAVCASLKLNAGAKFVLGATFAIPGTSWDFDPTSTVVTYATLVQTGMTYGNLVFNSASGGPAANTTLNIAGDLTITTATFMGIAATPGTNVINVTGNVNVLGAGRITGVKAGAASSASCTWNIGGSVSLSGATSRIQMFESNYAFTGASVININGDLTTVAGSQIMLKSSSSTTFIYPEGVINLKGSLVHNGIIGINSGTPTSPGLSINFVGTGPQSWVGAGTYSISTFSLNVNINNASGVILGSNITIPIRVAVNLLNGKLTTSNTELLTIGAGSISAGSSTSFVSGPLARTIAAGSPTVSFPVGDATKFAAVNLAFNTVTVGGTAKVSTTAGTHPSIATSGLYGLKSLSRYYTIVDTGMTFTSVDATLNFNTSDVVGGANTASYVVKQYSAAAWTTPTTANPLATSIQATGLASSISDLQIGELPPLPITYISAASGLWADASTWSPAGVPIVYDNVTIQTGHVITMRNPQGTCASLTMNSGSTLSLDTAGLAVPGSSWNLNVASTVIFNGPTTIASGPVYGNLTYASANGGPDGNLTVNGDLNITGVTVRGNNQLTGSWTHNIAGNVVLSGAGSRISGVNNSAATSASATWNIGGNVVLSGNSSNNRLICYESAGPHTGSAIFNINGNITIGTGSQIMFKSSSGTSANYPEGIINLKGNLTSSGPIGINSASAGVSPGLSINFVGTSPQALSFVGTGAFSVSFWTINVNINNAAGVTLASGIANTTNVKITTANGALLNTGTNVIAGTGSVIVNAGGNLASGSATGLDGNITATGATGGGNSLGKAANYIFNGAVAQTMGTVMMPDTIRNLTTNNTLGVATSKALRVNGRITLQAGLLDHSGFTISAKCDSVFIAGGSINPAIPCGVTVNISMGTGWNLVSVPVDVSIWTPPISVFTGFLGDAFKYKSGGYSVVDTLAAGLGYWVYYTAPTVVPVTGGIRTATTIQLELGWNLIGSREVDIPFSSLTTNPAGRILGDLFRFNNALGGYETTTDLKKGDGGWLYVTSACTLTIP